MGVVTRIIIMGGQIHRTNRCSLNNHIRGEGVDLGELWRSTAAPCAVPPAVHICKTSSQIHFLTSPCFNIFLPVIYLTLFVPCSLYLHQVKLHQIMSYILPLRTDIRPRFDRWRTRTTIPKWQNLANPMLRWGLKTYKR